MTHIDEVNFSDEQTGEAAFMSVRAVGSGRTAIEVDIAGTEGRLNFTVSIADALRIAERLAEAASDAAAGDA